MPNPNEIEGALPFDENRKEIQIGSYFQCIDATPNSPQASPLTLSGFIRANAQLIVPPGAVQLILLPVTNDLKVSNLQITLFNDHYDLILQGSKEPFECAGLESVNISGRNGDIVYFRFSMLGTS